MFKMTMETKGFPAIVVGTYEEYLLGFQPEFTDETDQMKLKQCFATHSHKGSIRCVASHGRYLLSSGADEYINVYDVVKKRTLTVINFHTSTVTSLEFVPDGSHFVSGDQNGDIAIFSCKDWSLVKHWSEAHKCPNGVLSVSVHPSGGLLMSASANNTLRFWNLIKGRQAYVVNTSKKCALGSTLNFTKWSRTGNYFAVCIGKLAEVYHTESAVLLYNTRSQTRCSALEFLYSDNFLLGFETGEIQIHSVKKQKMLHEEKCHDARIKSVIAFQRPSKIEGDNRKFNFLVTADSKGVVKLWRLRIREGKYMLVLKACVDIDCRITCMTLIERGVKEEAEEDEEDMVEEEEKEEEEGEEKEKEKEENDEKEKGENEEKEKEKEKEKGKGKKKEKEKGKEKKKKEKENGKEKEKEKGQEREKEKGKEKKKKKKEKKEKEKGKEKKDKGKGKEMETEKRKGKGKGKGKEKEKEKEKGKQKEES